MNALIARLSAVYLCVVALGLGFSPPLQSQPVEDAGATNAVAAAAALAAVDLSEQDQLDLDTCSLIVADIQATKDSTESRKFASELLHCSERLSRAQPRLADVWVWRGTAALELDDSKAGWEAARHLKQLGLAKDANQDARLVLAKLNRRGWLTDKYADVETTHARALSDIATAQRQAAAERIEAERAATLARAKTLHGWMEGKWEIENWLGGPLELQTQWERRGVINIRLTADGQIVVSGGANATARWTSDDSPPANYNQQLQATVTRFDPATNMGKGEFVSSSTYQAGNERGRPLKGNWSGTEFNLALARSRQTPPRVALESNGRWVLLRPAP